MKNDGKSISTAYNFLLPIIFLIVFAIFPFQAARRPG
jgi:hypothetical protein